MPAWELLLCCQFSQHIAVNVRGSGSSTRRGSLGLFRGTHLWEEQRLLVRIDEGIPAQEPHCHCLPGSLEFQSQVTMVSAINNGKAMGTLGYRSESKYRAQREATRPKGRAVQSCMRVLQEPLASSLGHHHTHRSSQQLLSYPISSAFYRAGASVERKGRF